MTTHRYPCTATWPADSGHQHKCMHNDAVRRYPVQHACTCGETWTQNGPPPLDLSWITPPPEPHWLSRHPVATALLAVFIVVVIFGSAVVAVLEQK